MPGAKAAMWAVTRDGIVVVRRSGMRLMLIEGIAALDSVNDVRKEWRRVLDTISNEWTSYQNSRTNDST